ncbi:MAG: PAS domain S-box protein, partial [Steroidobacteraceae bacterium]
MTTNKTGTVVMLKRSAEADTPSLTLPQVPSLPKRKSSIHPLLEEQLLEAADTAVKMQLRKLIEIVSSQYDAYENDRTSLETVMRLASDEATAITERLERESVVRLQAILDHVKDGIVSVDHLGRIESMNRTAERFFGVRQSDVLTDLLDSLIPDLAPHGDVPRALEELASAQETTHYDLAALEVVARHRRGELMPAEILVSKMLSNRRPTYIVCIRDTAERSRAEEALKDSEARYRVLVENAPEAVVVLDVESRRFVDCNDNAADFFKMSREDLLRVGPEQVSPPEQADGTPSFGISRGHIERALAGEAPVFEWLHRDAEGKLIPSEVRFVRLPSSRGNLIRASIIDIAERKQAELVAAGERRALEKIASSEPLAGALSSITEVVERVLPAAICCIRIYDPVRRVLQHVAGKSLPREYVLLMDNYPAEIRFGSCAAAIALQRQIIVPDISKDALWEHRRDAALKAGLHACWSTPITGADGRMLGTFATYLKRTGMPSRRDLELVGRMA